MTAPALPVVVVGAGPVGLAAAAHLAERGLPFVVLEAGDRVGAAVRAWGHVRTFTPWTWIVDPAAERLLATTGWTRPGTPVPPTGDELAEHYLEPLAAALGDAVRLGTRVTAVTREGMDKTRTVGRAERPFLLRVLGADGRTTELRARAVVDASGTWEHRNPLGAGGLPALGEQEAAAFVHGPLPDVLGRDRDRFAGRRTLVVGAGHSAAGTLLALGRLAAEEPGTSVVWAVRRSSPDGVYGGGAADQLPARGRLGTELRALVEAGTVELVTSFAIEALEADGDTVTVVSGDRRIAGLHGVVAATGFRPDLGMLSEVQLDLSPALEAPYAARAARRPAVPLLRHGPAARPPRPRPPRRGAVRRGQQVVRPGADLPHRHRQRAGPQRRGRARRRPGRRRRRAAGPARDRRLLGRRAGRRHRCGRRLLRQRPGRRPRPRRSPPRPARRRARPGLPDRAAGRRTGRRARARRQHAGRLLHRMTAAPAAAPRRRRRDFPGWRMVWALSVTETVSYGALFYCFAVMVVPMRSALDASTAQLSGALSLAIGVSGIASVPVGRALDRHGARWVMTGGSLLGAASVVAWSQARTVAELYLAFVGIGVAGAMALYDPAFALINTWFVRDRSAALLSLTVVAGFSSTVFVPLSQVLVDAAGWRTALLVLAGLLAACAVPQAVLLRRSPADLGLHPDGACEPAERPAHASSAADFAGLAGAWRTPAVRRLTLATVLETLSVTVVAVHLVASLRDDGVSAGTRGRSLRAGWACSRSPDASS